ncbi:MULTISPECIES: phytanoyl-CoA dioxygenase family protein [Catenuloplanes]|uniref:Ectoine hydroxylase-related dioxygenase (Phytanoyl-CoA dioxygenase family) n=1 Tax=Catenuloplanes niger TaxID=587534 RepID=A0AAE3ZUM7_9ACTN|nr:phytanoyl-CoA dioxygenase family protein [Catenuloplanes niger]MDR7325221.1 ectoine hydroxylase-related dioxygenase (phytanoyl-CoA dioxygenase family) [Catenuloplanes niger]
MNSVTETPVAARIAECDIRRTGLLPEHVTAFRRQGVLAVRGLLTPQELADVQEAGRTLIDRAWSARSMDDTVWTLEPDQPDAAPVRIEYVVDKSRQIAMLAGHPLLLQIMEQLVGPNLIPTWDSMVFKTPAGAPRLPWHRDAGLYDHAVGITGMGRVIDAGIYLDPAPEDNCVWCIPESNYWDDERVTATADRLNATEWDTTGAIPAVMQPGDLLLHNILTLHGAPAVVGKQRRVIYFEYRPAEVEWQLGPHTEDYIGLKQQALRSCVRMRAEDPRFAGEEPFDYRPAETLRRWAGRPDVDTLRFAHEDHWRW